MINQTLAAQLGEAPEGKIETAEELINGSGMNWRSRFAPVGHLLHERWIVDESRRMVLRDDTDKPLGIVGPSFVDIPNLYAFGIADPLIKAGGEFTGRGEYEGGNLGWVQMRMPIDPADVIDGDPVEPYLLITTGHSGNRSLMYKMTTIRVVCKNTLQAAMRSKTKNSGTIRHSGDTEAKIKLATELLDKHRIFFNDTVGIFRSFATTTINQPTVEHYFKTIAKVEPKHYKYSDRTGEREMIGRPATMYDRYMTAYHGERGGASKGRGTLWGALNAVTYVQDHVLVDEKNKRTEHKTASDRAQFQYFEASPRVSQEAFDLALQVKAGKYAVANN